MPKKGVPRVIPGDGQGDFRATCASERIAAQHEDEKSRHQAGDDQQAVCVAHDDSPWIAGRRFRHLSNPQLMPNNTRPPVRKKREVVNKPEKVSQ